VPVTSMSCTQSESGSQERDYNSRVLFDRDARNPEPPEVAGPSPNAVRSQLEKILSSDVFVHSPQLCRFLRFIVEQEIAGKGNELKEYTLGLQVFRKDESFDPRIDIVVRTEARRLRHKLGEYYQADGRRDPIEILLPKGSYRPTFQGRAEAAACGPAPPATRRTRGVWWAAGAWS
jgi:hypothetical protein